MGNAKPLMKRRMVMYGLKVVALFLKRMADALRDKDTILAVIKGSAINNDGKSAGLTVPNGKSQEA